MVSSAANTGGRRQDPRLRIGLLAQLVTRSGVHSVRLNNISREGAGITAAVPLKRGAEVILRWRQIDVFARVTWAEGTRCGLKFEQHLTAAEVMHARSLARGIVVTTV